MDRVSVGHFAKDSEARLLAVKEHLRSGTYQPKPVKRAWIAKAGSKQKRPLGIQTVTDRVAQQAARMALELCPAEMFGSVMGLGRMSSDLLSLSSARNKIGYRL